MKVHFNLGRFVRYCRLNITYFLLCREADKRFRLTGKNQFVMPRTDGSLVVIDRLEYRCRMNRAHKPVVGCADFYRECFYCARWRNGNPLNKTGRKAKRKMFLQFYL